MILLVFFLHIKKLFTHVISWVDRNPEYLLILISDHGRWRSNTPLLSHGPIAQGNEPIVVTYNPQLDPALDEDILIDPGFFWN